MFASVTEYGIVGRAFKNDICRLLLINPRDFTSDPYQRVDDTSYGGGAGMVMKIEPLELAMQSAYLQQQEFLVKKPMRVCLSPQGQVLNQALINQMSNEEGVIFVCGRYEGIDERFLETNIDLEVSVGDYVVSGGELPAMLLIDAIVRQLAGVVNDSSSITQDSFMHGLLDYPHYTKPQDYKGKKIPDVLLSGNHEQIKLWRLQMSLWRTFKRRPELLQSKNMTNIESRLLDEMIFKNQS